MGVTQAAATSMIAAGRKFGVEQPIIGTKKYI
jgi:hypothetical protein